MADLNPSDYTIDELADEIESIDDADALSELLETEAERDDRTGAKEAIKQRLQTVEDDTERDRDKTNGDAETIVTDDGNEQGEPGNGVGLIEIRDRVRDNTGALLGRDLDGITEIQANSEGWTAIVEVVERHSIPDTQDILGRYEIQLDAEGTIQGYRRVTRYRRGDTGSIE